MLQKLHETKLVTVPYLQLNPIQILFAQQKYVPIDMRRTI